MTDEQEAQIRSVVGAHSSDSASADKLVSAIKEILKEPAKPVAAAKKGAALTGD